MNYCTPLVAGQMHKAVAFLSAPIKLNHIFL